MSTIEEREAYLNNPFFTKHIYGDYTPFYITITVCTVLGVILFALNIIFGCCSKYKQYWEDRHTGNRFLVSLYTVSPHKNPPLDLSELQNVTIDYPSAYPAEVERPIEYTQSPHKVKRTQPNLERQVEYHRSQQGVREEFVELHKRESEI